MKRLIFKKVYVKIFNQHPYNIYGYCMEVSDVLWIFNSGCSSNIQTQGIFTKFWSYIFFDYPYSKISIFACFIIQNMKQDFMELSLGFMGLFKWNFIVNWELPNIQSAVHLSISAGFRFKRKWPSFRNCKYILYTGCPEKRAQAWLISLLLEIIEKTKFRVYNEFRKQLNFECFIQKNLNILKLKMASYFYTKTVYSFRNRAYTSKISEKYGKLKYSKI